MGNSVAYLMLAVWPVVCIILFTRLSLERALIWSFIGAYMWLPPITEYDLPLVPSMNKFTIPSVMVLIITIGLMGLRPSFMPRHWTVRLALILMFLGAIATVMTNRDPVVLFARTGLEPIYLGSAQLPGLRLIDIFSVISELLIKLIPFFLARQYLSSETGIRELMLAFVVAGLVYSVPALIEFRLSPQLNIWVYGFFQHSFAQMVRDGGYRAIVFMPHALWLALFFVMCMAAALALMKTEEPKLRVRYMLSAFYLLGIIYLCKSLASQLYALALLPLILYTPTRLHIRVALVIAGIAVLFPMLRLLELVPLDWIVAQAAKLSDVRAGSLDFRFDNEALLLDRAQERPLLGWGGWGRNLMYDPTTLAITTIPDSRWIIVFGTFGWVGYVSQMGLVALPLILMWWYSRRLPDSTLSPLIGPLCLMLGFSMVDMLVNDTLVPMTLLMIGAILGYTERLMPAKASSDQALSNNHEPRPENRSKKRTVL